MRTESGRVPAILAAAAGALFAALLALPGAHALDKPGGITITDLETRHAHVDAGKSGASAGDVDIYTLLLYNKHITPRSIGHASMTCTAPRWFTSSNSRRSRTHRFGLAARWYTHRPPRTARST